MNNAWLGADALASKDNLTAVAEYTKALLRYPHSPDYYTQRSTAFLRLSPPQNELALKDAEFAVLCAMKRASREKITTAQLRRAIALFSVKLYHDAAYILNNVVQKDRPEGTGTINKDTNQTSAAADLWKAKIHNKLKGMSSADLEGIPNTTVKEVPDRELPGEKEMTTMLKAQLKSDGSYRFEGEDDVVAEPASVLPSKAQEALAKENVASTEESATVTQPAPTPAAPASTMAPKIRHEWYQSGDTVTITIYAKAVSKDKAEVDIKEDAVSISFPNPTDPASTFELTFDPLFALINTGASSYAVMSTKVEVKLQKVASVKWPAIEGIAPLSKSTADTDADTPTTTTATVVPTTTAPATEVAPSYPTSSRNGPKNWDKLANELTAKPRKKTKKDDPGSDLDIDSEYDSDYDDTGDAGDAFFKKIYATSDPDVQRAMKKSYIESNGTALSTSWADVSKGPVKPVEDKKDDE